MDRETRRRFSRYRHQASDPQNAVIDDLIAGECDRGEFLRRATMFGLSTSAIAAALGAAGEAPLAFASGERGTAGGRLRLGVTPPPTGAIEPHTFEDTGGLVTGGISGEFLVRTWHNTQARAELATSWKPNRDASQWTFHLRRGAKFATGAPFGADDVLATYNRLLTAKDSQALSAFQGVLSADGVRKIDDSTVLFRLDAPTASFPFLVSSTTYQAIILPKSYQVGTFTTTPQTTGAFNLVNYQPGVSAKYDRNPNWWGGRAPLDGVDVTYGDDTAIVNGISGHTLDLTNGIVPATARALLNNASLQVFKGRSALHRQIPMRVDEAPFKDPRVRQAIALTINRPDVIKRLFPNLADLGNDNPFAPAYPMTVRIAQRHQDLKKAKQLIEAAGLSKGFSQKLVTYQTAELPALAQIVQQSVKAIGGRLSVKLLTSKQYFAGNNKTTPWLNEPMTITDWGHRAVPNVYLTSAYQSNGIWNAAHYKNKKVDSLIKSFTAAIDLKTQRKYAKQLELVLNHDVPVMTLYFYDVLNAGSKRIRNFYPDAQGLVWVSHTSLA